MEANLSYSLRGSRPDRSRFCYEISASEFKPAPSDLEIDDALAGYVRKLDLLGGRRERRKLYEYEEGDRMSSSIMRGRDGRVQDGVYPGVYSGHDGNGGRRAIGYPSPSVAGSNLESRVSRGSGGRGQHVQPSYAYGYESESGGRRGSSRLRDEDELSIFPEDSVSQVSTVRAPPSDVWSEQRGRSRRRAGSVISSSTFRPVRYAGGGGGGRQSIIYEEDVHNQPWRDFDTRDITPWAMPRR